MKQPQIVHPSRRVALVGRHAPVTLTVSQRRHAAGEGASFGPTEQATVARGIQWEPRDHRRRGAQGRRPQGIEIRVRDVQSRCFPTP